MEWSYRAAKLLLPQIASQTFLALYTVMLAIDASLFRNSGNILVSLDNLYTSISDGLKVTVGVNIIDVLMLASFIAHLCV